MLMISYFVVTQIKNDIQRRPKIEDLWKSLDSEDLNLLVKRLDEENMTETSLLVAAEFGSYKILKSIIELATTNFDEFKKRFNFDHCNERGHNVLHLSKSNLNDFYDPTY